jgi:hypothetical protein
MFLSFEDRAADCALVERVWSSRSLAAGVFHSMAESAIELVVTVLAGSVRVTLRGPVTRATAITCPPGGEWIALRFHAGVFLPGLPTTLLMDHNSIDLPTTNDRRFWLGGELWETPTFENAEVLAERLRRRGIIALDGAVQGAIEGDSRKLSLRSTQRHFLRTLGLTHARYRQVERARHAVGLLRAGGSIQDAVADAGYFDQAHMTRAFKALIGLSPRKVLGGGAQLSFLSNTPPPFPP